VRDTDEAQAWVAHQIARLRSVPYDELLVRRDDDEHIELRFASGQTYVGEISVFWDDSERRTLRVVVDVWDPNRTSRWGTFPQLTADGFIRAPDGTFVGE
jgi:hypothetical protein